MSFLVIVVLVALIFVLIRLERVSAEITQTSEKINQLNKNMDILNGEFNNLKDTVLETNSFAQNTFVQTIEKFNELNTIARNVNKTITESEKLVQNVISQTNTQIESLSKDVYALKDALKEVKMITQSATLESKELIQNSASQTNNRIDSLSEEVYVLKDKVAELAELKPFIQNNDTQTKLEKIETVSVETQKTTNFERKIELENFNEDEVNDESDSEEIEEWVGVEFELQERSNRLIQNIGVQETTNLTSEDKNLEKTNESYVDSKDVFDRFFRREPLINEEIL